MLFVSVRLIRLPEEKKGKKYFGANKEYGRKKYSAKEKKQEHGKAECRRDFKRGGTDRQYVNNVYENPEKIFSGREI